MTKALRHPPAPEDLPELYLKLIARLEKVEGSVRQLLAERTRDSLARPTWSDLQQVQADIQELKANAGLDVHNGHGELKAE